MISLLPVNATINTMKLYSRQAGTDAELAVYNWLEYTQFLGECELL